MVNVVGDPDEYNEYKKTYQTDAVNELDIFNLLIDMGWPKNIVLEKLTVDILELKLRREYRDAEEKGLKPDYDKFDDILDENLHRAFRSDEFRQMKLKLNHRIIN